MIDRRSVKARKGESLASSDNLEPVDGALHPGYVRDYVSGLPVKETPEEVQAVQVFARRLVEDYGYPKEHLQTRPQFRVRKRPSDEAKAYPVDIAIFHGSQRTEDQLYIVVECKQKNRRDGVLQLKLYLDMSPMRWPRYLSSSNWRSFRSS
jgi:type I restriction enzyme M protein